VACHRSPLSKVHLGSTVGEGEHIHASYVRRIVQVGMEAPSTVWSVKIGTDPAGPADPASERYVDSTKTLRGTLREYINGIYAAHHASGPVPFLGARPDCLPKVILVDSVSNCLPK